MNELLAKPEEGSVIWNGTLDYSCAFCQQPPRRVEARMIAASVDGQDAFGVLGVRMERKTDAGEWTRLCACEIPSEALARAFTKAMLARANSRV